MTRILSGDLPRSRVLATLLVIIAVGLIAAPFVFPGARSLNVAAKVAVRESDSAAQISAGIDTAERRVRTAVPIAKTIYLEPDIYRPTEADQSDPAIRSVRRSQAPVPPSADGGDGPRNPANPENPAPQPSPSE